MSKSNIRYAPLLDASSDDQQQSWFSHRFLAVKKYWKDVTITFLLILSVLLFVRQHQTQISSSPESRRLVPTGPDSSVQYKWWSQYSSMDAKDESAVDQRWDDIVPAHGIVAIDHSWAVERDLPATMALPSDHSKGVYIIDAYHQLHCLTVLRKTFYELLRQEPLTFPLGHATHCFDSLRQYTMCTGGDTLLYTEGRNITGDGQVRQCRNWGALRDWAKENSACYRDEPHNVPLFDHFGHCDNGTDGLILDA